MHESRPSLRCGVSEGHNRTARLMKGAITGEAIAFVEEVGEVGFGVRKLGERIRLCPSHGKSSTTSGARMACSVG